MEGPSEGNKISGRAAGSGEQQAAECWQHYSDCSGSVEGCCVTLLNKNQTSNVRKTNTETLSCNHCCSGKSISITYTEVVFRAFGIQHAMRMHRFTLLSMAIQYFPTLCHKGPDFRKNVTEHKMCVLIFSTTFV